MKALLIFLLCVQILYAKSSRSVNKQPMPHRGPQPSMVVPSAVAVGGYTDLTKARIDYDRTIQIGALNRVAVTTKPVVGYSAIYMNITNQCELNAHHICVPVNYGNKILPETKTIILNNIGGGSYEGYYRINTAMKGRFMLTFFIMQHGLVGAVYSNIRYTGSVVKTVYSPQLNYNWGNCKLFDYKQDHVGVQWRGRLFVPESRNYRMHIYADTTVTAFLDGRMLGRYSIDNGGDFKPTWYMTAGDHDFAIDFFEEGGHAQMYIKWDYLAGNSFVDIPREYLRSVGSSHVTGLLEATCFPGYTLDTGKRECVRCMGGRC